MDSTFNIFEQKEYPTLALCSPNKTILYSLGLAYGILNTLRYNATSELEFTYPQSHDGGITVDPAYSFLAGKLLVLVENVGYYIITDVAENLDGSVPIKEISAKSLEYELLSRRITNFPPLYTHTLQYILDDVLEDSPGWSTGYIPKSLLEELDIETNKKIAINRTFETKNTTLYKFIMEDVEKAFGCVFEFNSFTKKINAIPSTLPETPTNIVLSFDNLIQTIDFEEITEEICTVLYCYGANNIDIRDVNPYGGNAIYNFDYFKKDGWMTPELITAVNKWERLVQKITPTHKKYLSQRQVAIGQLVNMKSSLKVSQGELAATNKSIEVHNKIAIADRDADWTKEHNRLLKIQAKQEKKVQSLEESVQKKQTEVNNKNLIILEIVHGLYFSRKLSYISIREDLESLAASIGAIMGTWYDTYGKPFVLGVTKMSYASKVVTLTVPNTFKVGDRIIVAGVNDGFKVTHIDGTWTCQTGTNETKVIFTVDIQPKGTTPQTKSAGTVIKKANQAKINKVSNQVKLVNNDAKSLLKYVTNLMVNWIPDRPSIAIRNTIIDMINELLDSSELLESYFTAIISDATNPTEVLEDSLVRLLGYIDIISERQFSTVTTGRRIVLDNHPSYMTDTLYDELSLYIFENTYTNNNITTHNKPTLAETLEKANQLYKQGVDVLARTSQPRYEFSGEFVNFMALKEFSTFIDELNVGKIITIMKNDETYIRAALLEIELPYDSPEDMKLVFSNSFRLNNAKYIWASMFGQAVELSSTAKTEKTSQGNIGGWDVNGNGMQIGETEDNPTGKISSDGYISFGNPAPSEYGDYNGAWLGFMNTPKFSLYSDGNNYMQWDGSKLLIKALNFTLDSDGNITATSATLSGHITAAEGYIGGWVIGATDLMDEAGLVGMSSAVTAGDDIRFWAGHATPASAPFSVTEAGVIKATSGTIGGNVLSATSIGSTNYVANTSGWNISNTGVAEFENIIARGVIRSSVFEYDTISAIGGVLMVSQADVLASDMTALDASTLTIKGDATFVNNEVIRIKDGIDDEWMLVTDASGAPTYVVTRDLAEAYGADSNPTWKIGSTVVSTGVGSGTTTGYIKLDASTTLGGTEFPPFIDIYQRTGTAYSDTTLKVRLGWLKGIVDSDVSLNNTDVWGLYSDNVYLKGTIVASSGTIGGWTIDTTMIRNAGDTVELLSAGALSFGDTPPISADLADAGTGLWLDETGMYGLLAGVTQAKFDAVTGAITAGGGNVILNSDGIKIVAGAGDSNYIGFGTVVNSFYEARIGYNSSSLNILAGHPLVGTGTLTLSANTGTTPTTSVTSITIGTDVTISSTAGGGLFIEDSGLNVGTATGAGAGEIKTSGSIFINETANTFMTKGVTINQGANDNEIFSLKSSDVAHPFTSFFEADTFLTTYKASATAGGGVIYGLSEDEIGIMLYGMGVTDDTGKTTAANAYLQFAVAKTDGGTGFANIGANANIAVFRNRNTTLFILDGDGDSHQDVGTAWTNFDAFDDIALLDAVCAMQDPIKAEFGDWMSKNKQLLADNRIVTYNDDGHHFINWSRTHMLEIGAIRQLATRLERAEKALMDAGIKLLEA